MGAESSKATTKLQIRRTFTAAREKVYQAWTQRQVIEEWMCRDVPTQRATFQELDVRVGGRFLMEVTDSLTGATFICAGVYREVKSSEKLVFTWAWKKRSAGKDVPLGEETQVTLEFLEKGGGTEMVLTHELFRDEKAAKETNAGWQGCFDAMAKVLERI